MERNAAVGRPIVELTHPPSRAAVLWRAVLHRPRGGRPLPPFALSTPVRVDPGQVAGYRRVCGFADAACWPASFPQALAFPLQLALVSDRRFPFAPLGLVQLANTLRVLRPLQPRGGLRLTVWAERPAAHPKGAQFSVMTQLADDDGPLWLADSRALAREAVVAEDRIDSGDRARPADVTAPDDEAALALVDRWDAPAGIGRAYAAVSGDYNPIHLSALSARFFGFRAAIAHGLWSKARCVAALGDRLPAASAEAPLELQVTFHRPVLLPARLSLSASGAGERGQFRLLGEGGVLHLVGRWNVGVTSG